MSGQSTLSYHRLDIATGEVTVQQITIHYGMESAFEVLLHTLNEYNKNFAGKHQYWV